jgi:hypothetical protein
MDKSGDPRRGHVLYNLNQVEKNHPFLCGTDHETSGSEEQGPGSGNRETIQLNGEMGDLAGQPGQGEKTPADGGTCLRICELAIDTDYEYFTHHNRSIDDTLLDIETLMNGVNLIYVRDIGVGFSLSDVTICTSQNDPYDASNASDMLDQFLTHWCADQRGVQRDTAHLFFSQGGGSTIGVAYIGALCNSSYGYGVSRVTYSGNLARRISLVSHELGHNFSAGHCNGDANCGVMSLSIGGIIDRFGSASIGSMTAYSANTVCLDGGMSEYQVAPTADPDQFLSDTGELVLVDVLDNDYDCNGDPLLITQFDSISEQGGPTRVCTGRCAGGP